MARERISIRCFCFFDSLQKSRSTSASALTGLPSISFQFSQKARALEAPPDFTLK
jgi:hypothetical protein